MDPAVQSALIGAGVTVLVAVTTAAVAFRGFRTTRSANQATVEAVRQGQLTDSYAKAIEHLGDSNLDIRLGGIYALEGIARDSAQYHPTVMEVLTAFIRGHSHEQWPLPEHDAGPAPRCETRPDVQAALTVVGRRAVERDIPDRPIDLTDAVLVRADLTGAKLTGALLIRANLRDADLTGAHLDGADLTGADLGGTDLTGAHLEGTTLSKADLGDVRGLGRAHLDKANLSGAKLRWVDLTGAHLEGADLTGAHLERADLSGADLGGVRGLLQEQLDATLGDMKTKLPDGCRRPAAWSA